MSHGYRWLAAAPAAAFSMALAMLPQPAHASGNLVAFNGYSAGTIVVRTNERRLYLVMGDGRALRFPVGVGRAGKQ
jgi:lipoprotein-anchoring transpeptidase ErfK/SrfK